MGTLLRDNAGDEAILNLIEEVLGAKGRYNRLSSADESFSMQGIGG
jgi:hypothetical protein